MLSHVWRIPQSLATLRKFYRTQRTYTPTVLQPIFQKIPRDLQALNKADLRRIQDYPVLFISLFCELFAELRQKSLSENERNRLTLFSAAAPLHDDFFDNAQFSEEHCRDIYLNPLSVKANSSQEKVFTTLMVEFYFRFPQAHPCFENFTKTFIEFCSFQYRSRLQRGTEKISPEQLREISFGKGGTALLLSRLLMDNPPSELESNLIRYMGAWFQWLDDIVDIAKDSRESAQTLITSTTHIRDARSEVLQMTQRLFQEMKALPYNQTIIQKVIHQIFLISTSGWVHLNQLEKLEKKTNGVFQSSTYQFEELLWRQNDWRNIPRALPIWLSFKY